MKKTLILSVLVITIVTITLAYYSKQTMSEEKAIQVVEDQLRKSDKYEYILENSCVIKEAGKKDDYYLVEYHEKHGDGCPGTEGNQPLLKMFRVNKSKQVEVYDVIQAQFMPLNIY